MALVLLVRALTCCLANRSNTIARQGVPIRRSQDPDVNTLRIREEDDDFSVVVQSFDKTVYPWVITDSELHVVVGEGNAWQYEHGPITGPLEIAGEFDARPTLTLGTVIAPVRVESTDDAMARELSIATGDLSDGHLRIP